MCLLSLLGVIHGLRQTSEQPLPAVLGVSILQGAGYQYGCLVPSPRDWTQILHVSGLPGAYLQQGHRRDAP